VASKMSYRFARVTNRGEKLPCAPRRTQKASNAVKRIAAKAYPETCALRAAPLTKYKCCARERREERHLLKKLSQYRTISAKIGWLADVQSFY
jgi:hypothetical protein